MSASSIKAVLIEMTSKNLSTVLNGSLQVLTVILLFTYWQA